MIEVTAIGGYSEVGKNMTAVKIDNEVIILDMGFNLPKLIDFEEEGGNRENLTTKGLIDLGAIPNDTFIESWKDKVKAIVIGHCHLDHLGAVPFLARHYNAPIIGTPYTIEVLRNELKNDNISLKNELRVVNPNSKVRISSKLEIELIHITHSTLQTALIAIHSPYGTILYANDFKLDNDPILGKKPDYARLKKLGNENVLCLITESLYAHQEGKTPSENVAKQMLKDVFFGTANESNAIFATTFASHIARLKSIYEFGNQLGRQVVFLGKSMHKYIKSAEHLNLVKFPDAEIYGFARQVKKKLKDIEKDGRSDYLVICTGGQGEPESVLNKIVTGRLDFELMPNDHVIFSNRTIPATINIANRNAIEAKLLKKRVSIFRDIHTSGHSYKQDLRDMITMIKPKHIIPAHGPQEMQGHLAELTTPMGYEVGKNFHFMKDGKKINLV
nr:RNase J family beta-CASP ribonuclease [Candidatus Woesearchaeota archaeon]